jgi:hypothetical protein
VADELNVEASYVMELAKELIAMMANVVVKREDLANAGETLDTLRNYEEYAAVIRGSDTFDTYLNFEVDLLEAVGLTTAQIAEALKSKRNIPYELRDALVELKREKILEEFEEKNNYYRMLNGLPSTTDYLKIYIQAPIQGVDVSKPVHEMTDDEIFILNNMGYIESLKTKYPDRAYLKYLGANRIGVMTAREAKRFDIIRSSPPNNAFIKQRFDVNYIRSQTYILNNYYNRRFSVDQTYFDSYIGFMIMVNALIMTINEAIDIYNAKEYTNELMIHNLLQSYKLDIFDDIPFVYRKKIADNINSLIVSRGTDEVIAKIFSIFGFDDITVRKFILVKEHLKDSDDNYIFSYEADGVTPKYDEMYDVNFAQVDINSTNIDNEIRKPENRLAYVDVVTDDPYWGGYESKEGIRQKLLEKPFNYIDTDYININTAYNMSKLSFEVSYFLSMTMALRASLDRLVLTEPFLGQRITLFYAINMLAALTSRKVGFAGDIITDPIDIAVVHKFNFDRNMADVDAIMKKYGYTVPGNVSAILPPGPFTQPSELINLYFRNKEVYDRLLAIKTSTRSLAEYQTVSELLRYMSQSKLSASVFTKPNGQIAETYQDYLSAANQVVGIYLENLDDDLIDTTIFKLLTTLEEYIQTTRFDYVFLKMPTVSSENILKTYVLKLINTFKAFSINVFSMSVTYNIDDMLNNIKVVDSYSAAGTAFYHNNVTVVDDVGIRGTLKKETSIRVTDDLEIIAQLGGSQYEYISG